MTKPDACVIDLAQYRASRAGRARPEAGRQIAAQLPFAGPCPIMTPVALYWMPVWVPVWVETQSGSVGESRHA